MIPINVDENIRIAEAIGVYIDKHPSPLVRWNQSVDRYSPALTRVAQGLAHFEGRNFLKFSRHSLGRREIEPGSILMVQLEMLKGELDEMVENASNGDELYVASRASEYLAGFLP